MDMYRCGGVCGLVDMPGFGYAANTTNRTQTQWRHWIQNYLAHRSSLPRLTITTTTPPQAQAQAHEQPQNGKQKMKQKKKQDQSSGIGASLRSEETKRTTKDVRASRLFLLLDARVGWTAVDESYLQFMTQPINYMARIPASIILTKCDLVPEKKLVQMTQWVRHRAMELTQGQWQPDVFMVSGKSMAGVEAIRIQMYRWAGQENLIPPESLERERKAMQSIKGKGNPLVINM
jgi:GTP-binding protein EngB required for normal cell division